jgi:hypothetical protein
MACQWQAAGKAGKSAAAVRKTPTLPIARSATELSIDFS